MADTQVERNDAAMDTMAQEGQATDTVMAHLTTGEIVIPVTIAHNKKAMQMVAMMFELAGEDIEEFIVGSDKQKINPETGHPEFFSLKSFVSNPVKTVVNVAKDTLKTEVSVTKDLLSIPVNTTKDVINTGLNVTKDMIKGDVGGAIKDVGGGVNNIVTDTGNALSNAASDTVSGVKQGLKDAYTGTMKQLTMTMDAVGLLPKAPAVPNGPTSSPTVTQGDQNQRQQAVTDVQAAAGGASSSLTPRTVAGPDNDYKLNKSAVLGL